MKFSPKQSHPSVTSGGYITLMMLVFSGVFIILLVALTSVVFTQIRLGRFSAGKAAAFQAAEAGLDYYRWFLAHEPGSVAGDGTEYPVYDPVTGEETGRFALDVVVNPMCGDPFKTTVTSTGWSLDQSNRTRTLQAVYAKPSLAEYASVFNTAVWFGPGGNVNGRVHSNGGVRMDSAHDSLITASVEEWECDDVYGCDPAETVPGIWGSGPNSDLWDFPVPPLDFNGFLADLSEIKDAAQANTNAYWGPSGSGNFGYEVFLDGSEFSVNRVTKAQKRKGYYGSDIGWLHRHERPTQTTFLGTFSIPEECAVIFFEDTVWLSGTLDGKLTIAAADLIDPSKKADVFISDHIRYADADGSDGLTVISQNHIQIARHTPSELDMFGLYVAQEGKFIYAHYEGLGEVKDKLGRVGTIVSKLRPATAWYNENGDVISGFQLSLASYDRQLAIDPPPFTPTLSSEYQFVSWQEVE